MDKPTLGPIPSTKRLKKLIMMTLCGVIIFISKELMSSLPNIEPVSMMTMLMAVCFGKIGLVAVYVFVFLELFLRGLNLWNLFYLYVWLVLFVLAYLFRKMKNVFFWAVLCGLYGFSFGGLCAIVYLFIGGWNTMVSWWLAGIAFDLLHAGGNFFITLFLFVPLRKVLDTLNKRYFK